MSNRVDLYDSTYGNFQEQVLAEIRRETYGEDIGQNSWITADEYDTFYSWLELTSNAYVLEGCLKSKRGISMKDDGLTKEIEVS